MRFFTRLHRPVRYVCLLLIAFLAVPACTPTSPFGSSQQLPVDVKALIPSDWAPLGGLKTIDMDGSGQPEYLLFFRYGVQKGQEGQAPIGGVVFDTEVDSGSGMSRLVPYRLLPDFSPGKGQGFLAEDGTPSYEVADANGDGLNDLIITGNGHDPAFPMYLTIFSRPWGQAYQVLQRFFGDGGVSVESSDSGQISKVVTKTRLNERSQLSQRTEYVLEGGIYTPTTTSLDFTYGIPDTPYYPESAVLAYYLLLNAGQTDLADSLLAPQEILTAPGVSLSVATQTVPLEAMGANTAALTMVPAQMVPLASLSVPASAGPALPVKVSYSSGAVEGEFAAPAETQTAVPAGPLSTSQVIIDVLENGQQAPTTHVWRVVNLSQPEDKGRPRWRLLGQ